jgi:hypothetical protein
VLYCVCIVEEDGDIRSPLGVVFAHGECEHLAADEALRAVNASGRFKRGFKFDCYVFDIRTDAPPIPAIGRFIPNDELNAFAAQHLGVGATVH